MRSSTQKLNLKVLKRSLRDRLFYSNENKPMPLETKAAKQRFDVLCDYYISW